ncbi:hypothetical protein PVK06_049207 [Gossypium arboreum]|uniref:Uncharacterized protein n=1 Tax=Gossypium arboreum TaxID=29729 RepID=A0ABR0MIK6_GOSAR|nr:hypothetical protein PVK06_049207 [Gossypium arboreum]
MFGPCSCFETFMGNNFIVFSDQNPKYMCHHQGQVIVEHKTPSAEPKVHHHILNQFLLLIVVFGDIIENLTMSIFFRVVIAEAGNFEELLYSNENSALTLLKKTGGTVNCRNRFGLTPLHIATWRNHLPIIQRLVAAGADPDAKDGESGWSSLHRALHFGHLAVASILLQSGASITLEDSKCRTPIDLLSGPVLKVFESGLDSVATEVFSWGSGVNYQLGTGNAHIQKLPCKLDSFHGSIIKLISAAKFHSVAVTAHGKVYTWGFGRGGRLGHPDFDIHSGQAAVITTHQVTFGLGARRVKAIAAAKHHTVVATEVGEVVTWGSTHWLY